MGKEIEEIFKAINTPLNYKPTLIFTKEEKEYFLKYFPETAKEMQIIERNKVYVR